MIKAPEDRLLLLDIGSDSIKALNVSTGRKIPTEIKKQLVLPNIRQYLAGNRIAYMDGLLDYLCSELKKSGIEACPTMVCSSVLGISSELKMTSATLLDGTSIQVFGRITAADGQQITSYVESTATDNRVQAFVLGMERRGYQVLSVEDAMTATMSLMRTGSGNGAILSLGNKTIFYEFLGGIPIARHEFTYKTNDMLSAVSSSLGISYEDFRNVFAIVGLDDNKVKRALLIEAGIEPTSYFREMREYFVQYFDLLKEFILNESALLHSEGDYTVVLTGGIMDVPKLIPLLVQSFEDEEKKPRFIYSYSASVREQFGACFGMLRRKFRQTVNLAPIRKARKSPSESLAARLNRITMAACLVGFIIFGGIVIGAAARLINPPVVEAKGGDTIQAEHASLLAKETILINQLRVLESIDKTPLEVFEFAAAYQDPELAIISIDSVSELEPTPQMSRQGDLIIRGYALTSGAVSNLCSELTSACIVRKTDVVGIEKAVLASGEEIYLFEICLNNSDSLASIPKESSPKTAEAGNEQERQDADGDVEALKAAVELLENEARTYSNYLTSRAIPQQELVEFASTVCQQNYLKLNILTGGEYNAQEGAESITYQIEVQGMTENLNKLFTSLETLSPAYSIESISYRRANSYKWIVEGSDEEPLLMWWGREEDTKSGDSAEPDPDTLAEMMEPCEMVLRLKVCFTEMLH